MSWAPYPGFQWEFCRRGEFEVLAGGAAGPGKTQCLVWLALRHIEFPGYRGLLLRRSFPRLIEIQDRAAQVYPSLGGEYRSSKQRWQFPSGATITLGHMVNPGDERRFHGHEFQFFGFDELTEFEESQYLYMMSRLRTTDPRIPLHIRCTTNPGGIGHQWVKERFVDIATPGNTHVDPVTGLSRVFIPGRIYDNLGLMESDPNYARRLEALPYVERRRQLDGDWDIFAGQVFPTLSQRVHGVEPFEIPPDWPKFMVLDWGYAKPFSIGWYAIDYDDVLYRYREWYGCEEGEADKGLRLTASEVAEGILKRETEKVRTRIADPSIFSNLPGFRSREARGPNIGEDLMQCGVACLKADNDRMQGLQQVHKRFALDPVCDEHGEIVREEPRVRIFNDCHHFWRTMQQLTSDAKNVEDVDTKSEDHIYDEFRYACMHRPLKPRKVELMPEGSFARERQRLLRARQMARRTGESLESAYTRLR